MDHCCHIFHTYCRRAPLFTQPCPHCSHSRAPGEQWARLCVFTLQGCVQAARLCRGSPVCMQNWLNNTTWHQTNESPIYLFQCNVNTTGYNSFVLKHQRYWSKGTSENMALVVFNRLKIAWKCVIKRRVKYKEISLLSSFVLFTYNVCNKLAHVYKRLKTFAQTSTVSTPW